MLGSNNAPTSIPTSSSIISVEVSLQGVADLTKMAEQRRLKTNVQELTGDWRYYHTRTLSCPVPEPRGTNAPTQDLGEALFGTPYIEGFRAVSAKVPNQKNLIVFPQKLRKGSYLRYRDSDGNVVDEING